MDTSLKLPETYHMDSPLTFKDFFDRRRKEVGTNYEELARLTNTPKSTLQHWCTIGTWPRSVMSALCTHLKIEVMIPEGLDDTFIDILNPEKWRGKYTIHQWLPDDIEASLVHEAEADSDSSLQGGGTRTAVTIKTGWITIDFSCAPDTPTKERKRYLSGILKLLEPDD